MNDDEEARIRQLLDKTLSENEDDIVYEKSEDKEDQLEIDIFEDTDADPNFEVDEQSDVLRDNFFQRREHLGYNTTMYIHTTSCHNQPPHQKLLHHSIFFNV
ncbi:hypothetical protein J6590_052916 [Homalodisca vitripennis]|nr:hypothetical protein J6590_052916 [Homalodisca vitripennis]